MKKRTDRRPLPPHSSIQLIVLAGLPPGLHNRVASEVPKILAGNPRVMSLPSSVSDGVLYPKGLVQSLLRSVGSFAVRRRSNGPASITVPASIVLLYVPAPDQEKLLRAFDFFAFPIPLPQLANWDAQGRQLRHQFEHAVKALSVVLSSQSLHREAFDHVKQRVDRLAAQEPFLLPPRNFHASETSRVGDLFREVRSGQRPWTDRFPELRLKLCNSEIYVRLEDKETIQLFQDHRDVLFPPAHMTAYHAPVREIEEEENSMANEAELRSTLQTLYRFGVALPNGFHHDAAQERGAVFREFSFDCSRAGTAALSGEYMNIYPDDFVRVGKPRKK